MVDRVMQLYATFKQKRHATFILLDEASITKKKAVAIDSK